MYSALVTLNLPARDAVKVNRAVTPDRAAGTVGGHPTLARRAPRPQDRRRPPPRARPRIVRTRLLAGRPRPAPQPQQPARPPRASRPTKPQHPGGALP